MPVSRRGFIVGCSAAIAAMAGGRISGLSFAREASAAAGRDTLVVVFLRGGCDGLSLVAPCADPEYITRRPRLRLVGEGTGANLALPLGNTLDPNLNFRLHPQAAPLRELYDAGKMAIVHACGLVSNTRSHFDAMALMERASGGNQPVGSGWLTRHLTAIGATAGVPAIASSTGLPTSLLGSTVAVSMQDPASFRLRGSNWRYDDHQAQIMRDLYGGTTAVHAGGQNTLRMVDEIQSRLPRDGAGRVTPYAPDADASYPTDWYARGFGDALKSVAQMIKLEVGLEVATIDFGGWDTHENQGNVGGTFSNQIDALARGLGAFYNDLQTSGASHMGRTTVIVMSEFGRRFRENASGGTDHGHGNLMLVLGDNVNGGRMYGRWPGLTQDALDNGVDLAITTDYRQVLGEIVVRRLANPALSAVFPSLTTYAPLGVVTGTDLPTNLAGPSAPAPPPIAPSTMPYRVLIPSVTRR